MTGMKMLLDFEESEVSAGAARCGLRTFAGAAGDHGVEDERDWQADQ